MFRSLNIERRENCRYKFCGQPLPLPLWDFSPSCVAAVACVAFYIYIVNVACHVTKFVNVVQQGLCFFGMYYLKITLPFINTVTSSTVKCSNALYNLASVSLSVSNRDLIFKSLSQFLSFLTASLLSSQKCLGIWKNWSCFIILLQNSTLNCSKSGPVIFQCVLLITSHVCGKGQKYIISCDVSSGSSEHLSLSGMPNY